MIDGLCEVFCDCLKSFSQRQSHQSGFGGNLQKSASLFHADTYNRHEKISLCYQNHARPERSGPFRQPYLIPFQILLKRQGHPLKN